MQVTIGEEGEKFVKRLGKVCCEELRFEFFIWHGSSATYVDRCPVFVVTFESLANDQMMGGHDLNCNREPLRWIMKIPPEIQ